MKSFTAKQILGLFFLLLIGIPISLYVIKQQQDLRQQATGCDGAQIKVDRGGSEVSYTLDSPDDTVITGVCIKSGSGMFGGSGYSGKLGNGDYENGCYTVWGVNTKSITVRKNSGGSNCQDISHIEMYTGKLPTSIPPTNTPVPPATNTPVPPTRIPPSNTPVPPTATRIPPTVTPTPPGQGTPPSPTPTRIPPTNTPIPPTATRVPPSATPTDIPPTIVIPTPTGATGCPVPDQVTNIRIICPVCEVQE